MKVNRNTINDDIKWLYEKMSADIEGDEFNGYFTKQIVRLETQRGRLMSYLPKAKELDKKLVIERQLSDIDFRLAAMMEKFKHGYLSFWDEVYKAVNKIVDQEKLPNGYTTIFEQVKIPIKKRKAMNRFLDAVKEA